MEVSGARVLVAGATGVLGGAITAELAERGAREALAGHDPGRLSHAARSHPGVPTARFDAYDPESCARAVRDTSAVLEELDTVVIASGSVAFGAAEEVGDAVTEHLMAVNFLAPTAFLRAALGMVRPNSAIAAVTGVVAKRPQPRMADHGVSKAALSVWLDAVRREARSAGVGILEIRPPLPGGGDRRQVAGAVADALAADAEPLRKRPDRTPAVERRAR